MSLSGAGPAAWPGGSARRTLSSFLSWRYQPPRPYLGKRSCIRLRHPVMADALMMQTQLGPRPVCFTVLSLITSSLCPCYTDYVPLIYRVSSIDYADRLSPRQTLDLRASTPTTVRTHRSNPRLVGRVHSYR